MIFCRYIHNIPKSYFRISVPTNDVVSRCCNQNLKSLSFSATDKNFRKVFLIEWHHFGIWGWKLDFCQIYSAENNAQYLEFRSVYSNGCSLSLRCPILNEWYIENCCQTFCETIGKFLMPICGNDIKWELSDK